MIFKCNICKDDGFLMVDKDGKLEAEQCTCLIEQAKENKLRSFINFAEMPEQLKELKISDFRSDIYENERNVLIAKKAKRIVINYITGFESVGFTGLYLYSNTKGSGKTRLAVGIGNALINNGKMVKFCTTTRLIEEIKESMNTGTHSKYLNAIKSVPVLILDDIGTERLSDWVNETFYSIINERMLNQRITIYTSNCTIAELKHDERIKSRIEGTVYPVQCPEEDIRVKLKKNDNLDIEKILLR